MTQLEMLQTLSRWQSAGWLRSLDLALARFVSQTDPAAPTSLLLATAFVSHMEGRGHSGLPLPDFAARVQGGLDVLGWPIEALHELQAALKDWPTDAAALQLAWGGLPSVALEAAAPAATSPLVVAGGLLYLRRYWQYESRVAAQITARVTSQAAVAGAATTAASTAAPTATRSSAPATAFQADKIDPSAARTVLERLFGPLAPGAQTDWQMIACALALRARLTIITGGPGTGKTYTAARLLVLLQSLHAGPQALRVALAAPTGKAAARLRQAISQALRGLIGRVGPVGASEIALPQGHWAQHLAPARTLHALLGTQPGTRRFRHNRSNPLEVDVLFVDEASMVHLEMMAQLLEALPERCRVVLLGDKDQLASVEAGAVLGDLCQGAGQGGPAAGYRRETADWVRELTGQDLPQADLGPGPPLAQQTVVLRHSHRFEGPIGQLAQVVNSGQTGEALQMLRAQSDGPIALAVARDASVVLRLAEHGRTGAVGGYSRYLQQLARRPLTAAAGANAESPSSASSRSSSPSPFNPVNPINPSPVWDDWAKAVLRSFDSFRVLCAVRDGLWGVSGLNAAIERALAQAGLLSGSGEWYEGRPVMVTRNDPALGVFNGDIGIVLRGPAKGAALRCCFLDGDSLRSVAISRLAEVETAFAMTVHKSQGSEFEHVALVLPEEDVPVLTRELIYTGITRASQAFTLVAKQPSLLNSALGRLTRRVSGLRKML